MQRRTFLKGAGAALIGTLAEDNLCLAAKALKPLNWSGGLKPLYCLAYIDPEYAPHKGQDSFISKYPIAVLPQDSRTRYYQLRNRLRILNPQQKVFAYQMTLDENGLRGPGHELIRTVTNSWLTLPGGITPTIDIPSGNIKKRRLYDPRSETFRQTFVQACQLLINENGFDGIFFDNFTIYNRFAKIPVLGPELMQGLQQLILDVRAALPNTILIGNGQFNWIGLNGEMNEGRPNDLVNEAKALIGHQEPVIEMFHYYMKNQQDLKNAELNFRLALANRCFYGTGINAQAVRWYDFFDKVLSEYEIY